MRDTRPVRGLLWLVLGLALAGCATDAGAPRSSRAPSFPMEASSPTSFEEPVLGPRRNRAATDLKAGPDCAPEAVVHLSWSPARNRGTAQKVAVTPFADGFETGRFEVSPRLPASASRYDWTGTSANSAYRWRVLTKHSGWVGSRIGSFIAPSCGVEDYG